jgi:N-acetylmuramoyl-L-alanine amidase
MWLGWMTRFDRSNWVNGVAGIAGRNIDAIQMELVGVPGYQIEYRVGTYRTKGYLNWIRGYGAGSMGYAGIYGQNIDRIQMRIVKI